MLKYVKSLKTLALTYNQAENGNLTVIEGEKDIPFQIQRIFIVRAPQGAVRGGHAHIICNQFLICTAGKVEVVCRDETDVCKIILDKPNIGILIPSGIWAEQRYIDPSSVLTVLCDRNYEETDYIRNYGEYLKYRTIQSNGK